MCVCVRARPRLHAQAVSSLRIGENVSAQRQKLHPFGTFLL